MATRDWNTTASDNDDADSDIDLIGSSASIRTADNSMRAIMQKLAIALADTNGSRATTGSSNAYLYASAGAGATPADGFSAYATGDILTIEANHSNTGAATLNVDSVGAKAIRTQADAALSGGEMIAGGRYQFIYDETFNSAAGAWVLITSSGVTLLDEDDMASDSATKGATQQSIKAYVDKGYIKLSDVKAASTDSGTFTSGSWQTRTLNTKDHDTNGNCTLSSNQFTLDAGTYRISASAPAERVNQHKAKLRNVTDSSDVIIGTAEYANSASATTTESVVSGLFTIASSKTFELQHQCSTTRASTGFGLPAGYSVDEVYAVVQLWKMG